MTEEALPATVVDLAARNLVDIEQRGPDVFYVRLREGSSEALKPYEERVLAHLRRLASGDVVPVEALTTGPEAASKRWRQRFANEVVADAQRLGLSRDALGSGAFTKLLVAAAIPAVAVWALSNIQFGFFTLVGGGALLTWIRQRHPQRETPNGLEAASRWLGVRAELAENDVFPTHSPLTVEFWSRLLAYGAALGVATGASAPLPMGAESDTNAWSSYGGNWRPVRISYPQWWPPAWGLEPRAGILSGLRSTIVGALVLYFLGPTIADMGAVGLAILVVPCAAVVYGVAVAVMAATDLGSAIEVTGPILRLRTFGTDKQRRYYAAVDDGSSRTIRALRVRPHHYMGLRQGQLVTVQATKSLGCVRWIIDGPPEGADLYAGPAGPSSRAS